MNWEVRFAIALMLLLVLLSLQACGQMPVVDQVIQSQGNEAVSEQLEEDNSPPNFQGIANALGCVFAPDSCSNR